MYLKRITKKILELIGYELIRIRDINATGYDSYILEAKKLGIDVNDYCEKELGWGDKSQDCAENVCVHCRKDETELLEIGAGTGGYSRYLVDQVSRLHLTDKNEGFVTFLQDYFKKYNHINFIPNSTNKFPKIKDNSIDIVFGGGCSSI